MKIVTYVGPPIDPALFRIVEVTGLEDVVGAHILGYYPDKDMIANHPGGARVREAIRVRLLGRIPPAPEPPPVREVCDSCGELPANGRHKLWLCRFVIWVKAVTL